MVRRLCILCLLFALWPALALAESATLLDAYNRYKALYEQGRYAEAEPFARRALDLGEQELGPDHPTTGALLNNLADLYLAQGRHAEAEPLHRRALAIREKVLGPEHADVGQSLNNLAALYRAQGRYDEAEPLYRRALAIWEKALGSEHLSVATSLNNLAALYYAQGRYAEAEPLLRRAMVIEEKTLGPDHAQVAATLSNLANLYRAQGRTAEAEPLFKRVLAITTKVLGPDHAYLATSLNNLATLYRAQGRTAEAEPLYKRSLAIKEKALGPDHPDVAQSLNNLAALYRGQGRYAEAEPLHRRALAIRQKALGPNHPEVGESLNNLATLHRVQGRYTEAESLLKRSLAIKEKALGPDHPDVALSLNNLADVYWAQDRTAEVIASMRRATAIHRRRLALSAGGLSAGAESEQRSVRVIFLRHLFFAHSLMQHQPAKRQPLLAEAFEVGQLTRATAASSAVARAAARFAAGDDELAQVVRQRQDALERWRGLDERIVRASSRSPDKRDPETEIRLREELEAVRRKLGKLDERLVRDFPDYAEIANPRPVALGEAQALLAADEVLVSYAVWDKVTFLQVVRSDRAAMHEVGIGADELREAVGLLRGGLKRQGVESHADLLARGFDGGAAFALYRKLFAPAEPLLEGARHVFVVPDDALQSLPLGVLLTDAPQGEFTDFAGYRQAPWLARKYAMTVLPSVSSLRALRRFAKVAKARKPFKGFGDPVLEGRPGDRRGLQIAGLFRGALADVDAVRRLAPLPETADELRAIAKVLNADEGSVFLGNQATERAARNTDLSDSRVLTFATHGLIAGQIKGAAEPALVLSPPAVASDQDDGLLTASEIARHLELDADWVILSACNTAAGDEPGAEGLSGLAKAFFYAGARALLVSHWAVDSEAAVGLTTGMLAEAAQHPAIGRAEALKRSMLALMEDRDNPHFAHPLFWAPFVVVGEGGAPRRSAD
ncbi:MAG: tetratricopeptide repeat protein [Kiloniellales bacterium]